VVCDEVNEARLDAYTDLTIPSSKVEWEHAGQGLFGYPLA
jgi:hypothetical protein